MKESLVQLLQQAVRRLCDAGDLPAEAVQAAVKVERARKREHGDFACGVALALAGQARTSPMAVAQKIADSISDSPLVDKVQAAAPGFVNIFLSRDALAQSIQTIRRAGEDYGRSDFGGGETIMVEFVSANPTGPLHVGHGRGAACGDALARVLVAAGFAVLREYYFNDSGRQMDILALSVWLRALENGGEKIVFPENAYRGGYIKTIAQNFCAGGGEVCGGGALFENLPAEDEKKLDELIARGKKKLGADGWAQILNFAAGEIMENIRADLAMFRVSFDNYFSEASLAASGALEKTVAQLKNAGHLYEKDGALWFCASKFGDTEDRVVRRANGAYTYFAPDIAYHLDKVRRGCKNMINILGADHHGYIERVRAALSAAGCGEHRLDALFLQQVNLINRGKKLQMSTRRGEFVPLRTLCEEVGVDAARFFYLLRKPAQKMNFDLALARAQSSDNPVYYVQYAHARICSVLAKAAAENGGAGVFAGADYALLQLDAESDLLGALLRYPETVTAAARQREPHQIAYYLREVANYFHVYYNRCRFIEEQAPLRAARLALIDAARIVIANGLGLLGVSAPEKM